MIEEPELHASGSSQKPNSALDHSTSSAPRRERCVAQVAAAREVVEHEVAPGDGVDRVRRDLVEARARARAARRSVSKLTPASAPAPSGSRPACALGEGEALAVALRASRSTRAGGGRDTRAGRAAGGCSRASASRRAPRARSSSTAISAVIAPWASARARACTSPGRSPPGRCASARCAACPPTGPRSRSGAARSPCGCLRRRARTRKPPSAQLACAPASSPASSASRSSAEMMPRAASMRACARDCAMSCGHRRRSKPIDAFRRWKSGCWGSLEARHGRSVYGGGLRRQHRAAARRHARDLALAHLREERQRQRARGHVLADRELARRGGRSARGRSSSGGSPAGRACSGSPPPPSARTVSSRSTPRGQLHDEHEPAAPVRRPRPRTAARAPRCPTSASRYSAGHARARGEHLLQARELRDAERAGDVRQAVVEAEPVVVEPAHVGRAALVALGVDPLLELGRRRASPSRPRRSSAACWRRSRTPRGARAPPTATPSACTRAERLARVLDDRQIRALPASRSNAGMSAG